MGMVLADIVARERFIPRGRRCPAIDVRADFGAMRADVAEVAPLVCRACGAPVPLPPANEVPCSHCGARIAVPAQYATQRAKAEGTRQLRQAAEREWRKLPRPLPSWFVGLATFFIVASSIVLTTASLIGWVFYDLFASPRNMLMLGVFTPLFFVILGLVETLSAFSYARHVEALAALPPVHGGEYPRCRMCGAPLLLEPGAIAATCGYCCTDSVMTRPSARSQRRLAWERASAERSLDEALRAAYLRRSERRLARYITVGVLVVVWLIMWFAFPSS
jgi:hypothetical protein